MFDETRRLVSARDIAELNGLQPNRSGYICCPLHREKTPSLKLYDDGSWHCFGCGKGGSSIDLEMELYDLKPLDAVRRLNDDFRLGLPLDRPPDKEERAAAQHRRELHDTYELFQQWRGETIDRLNECFRMSRLIQKFIEKPADLDQMSDLLVYTIQHEPYFEYLSNLLTFGTLDNQMEVSRMRKEVDAICNRVLSDTPTRSSAA